MNLSQIRVILIGGSSNSKNKTKDGGIIMTKIEVWIEQCLFLCEQYLQADAWNEAQSVLKKLESSIIEMTENQQQRYIQCMVQAQSYEQLIGYYETGNKLSEQYLPELIDAYLQFAQIEEAEVLVEMIMDYEVQTNMKNEIACCVRKKLDQCEQQFSAGLHQIPIQWEQLVAICQREPKIFTIPKRYKWFCNAILEQQIPQPFLAAFIDLAVQSGYTFTPYESVRPLEQTEWVQHVRTLVSQQENAPLLEQLAIYEIMHIYPHELSDSKYRTIEQFIQEMQQLLFEMLTKETF